MYVVLPALLHIIPSFVQAAPHNFEERNQAINGDPLKRLGVFPTNTARTHTYHVSPMPESKAATTSAVSSIIVIPVGQSSVNSVEMIASWISQLKKGRTSTAAPAPAVTPVVDPATGIIGTLQEAHVNGFPVQTPYTYFNDKLVERLKKDECEWYCENQSNRDLYGMCLSDCLKAWDRPAGRPNGPKKTMYLTSTTTVTRRAIWPTTITTTTTVPGKGATTTIVSIETDTIQLPVSTVVTTTTYTSTQTQKVTYLLPGSAITSTSYSYSTLTSTTTETVDGPGSAAVTETATVTLCDFGDLGILLTPAPNSQKADSGTFLTNTLTN